MTEQSTKPDSSGAARRVILVDDRPERRGVMRHLLSRANGADVVGDAADTDAALEAIEQHEADAVVLDIQMPVDNGLRTIAALRHRHPRLGIVVCSFHADRATRHKAELLGADLYLTKPISSTELGDAISGLDPAEGPARVTASPVPSLEEILAGGFALSDDAGR